MRLQRVGHNLPTKPPSIQPWWGRERVSSVKGLWRGKTSIDMVPVWQPVELQPLPWKRGWNPEDGALIELGGNAIFPSPLLSMDTGSYLPSPLGFPSLDWKKAGVGGSLQGQLRLSCSWAHWLSRGLGVSQWAHHFEQSPCSTMEGSLVLESARKPWLWPSLHSLGLITPLSNLISPPLQGRSWASIQPPYATFLWSTHSMPEV